MKMKKKALLAAGALALSTLFSTAGMAANPPASCVPSRW